MEAIRTSYEFYVEKLLNYLEIPFFTNQLLCFQCENHFYWSDSSIPPRCFLGQHGFSKGQFARPDFVLGEKTGGPFSVLRVDGGIHERRIQKKKDKFQEKALKELKIPYFVSENDFWLGSNGRLMEKMDWARVPARHLDYLLGCWCQTIHPSLYSKYNGLKEIKDSKLI